MTKNWKATMLKLLKQSYKNYKTSGEEIDWIIWDTTFAICQELGIDTNELLDCQLED